MGASVGLGLGYGEGKSKTKGEDISPYAALAANLAKKVESETDPVRSKLMSLILQVLTAGGSAALTPIANQATAAGLQSTDQSVGQAGADLARTTGGRSDPTTVAILNALKQQGSFNTAEIPTDIGKGILNMAPGVVSSQNDFISRLIGEAISGSRYYSQNTRTSNFNAQLAGQVAAGQSGGGAGGAGGGSQVYK